MRVSYARILYGSTRKAVPKAFNPSPWLPCRVDYPMRRLNRLRDSEHSFVFLLAVSEQRDEIRHKDECRRAKWSESEQDRDVCAGWKVQRRSAPLPSELGHRMAFSRMRSPDPDAVPRTLICFSSANSEWPYRLQVWLVLCVVLAFTASSEVGKVMSVILHCWLVIWNRLRGYRSLLWQWFHAHPNYPHLQESGCEVYFQTTTRNRRGLCMLSKYGIQAPQAGRKCLLQTPRERDRKSGAIVVKHDFSYILAWNLHVRAFQRNLSFCFRNS